MYTVRIAPAAERQLDRLPPDVKVRLSQCILALEKNPRPPGVIKLTGKKELYRLRISEYRVIYRIQDKQLGVLIVKVAHRKNAYD